MLKEETPKEQQELLRVMSLVGDKQAELTKLNAQIAEANKTQDILREAQQKLEDVTKEISLADELLISRKAEADKLLPGLELLRKQTVETEEELKSLKDAVSKHQGEIDLHLESVAAIIRQRDEAMENEFKRKDEAVKAHEALLLDFESQEQEAKRVIAGLLNEIEDKKNDIVKVTSEVDQVKYELDELKASQKSIIDEATLHLATIKADEESAEAQLNDAKEAKRVVELDTEMLKTEKADLVSEIGTLKLEFANAKEQVALKIAEIDTYKRNALNEIADMLSRARLDKTTQTLADAINSIQES